jgi:hypothetical protein
VRGKTGILFRVAEAAVLFARKITTGAGRAGGH